MNNRTDPIDVAEVEGLNAELRAAIRTFSGKWKLEVLWLLSRRVHRFNELKRALPGVTQHMLTSQLRELEVDGMVSRTIFPEIPPRVEYALTEKSRGLAPVFREVFVWARGDSALPPGC